ncbi:MAG: threonine/serine exporter family protein [Dorea sp.]
MMLELFMNVICSFYGTLGFALMFHVPPKYFFSCGMTGVAGWMVFKYIVDYTVFSSAVASFLGAFVVVLISRILTVVKKCPITIFLISGIVPLVPGAGVYFTAYYLVTDQLALAVSQGMEAVKIAFGIVLGIVFVLSIPREFFGVRYWKQRWIFSRRVRNS